MKKRRVFSLLAFAVFSVSCGNPSTSLDTSATNDIDYYWDVIQYDRSPIGYYRFRDGWYAGDSSLDAKWTDVENSMSTLSKRLEEQTVFQVEWVKGKKENLAASDGEIIALEGHYRYEESRTGDDAFYEEISSTLLVSDGIFSLNQTIIRELEGVRTTNSKKYYGPWSDVIFHTDWGTLYLKPNSYGTYAFSKETSILDYKVALEDDDGKSGSITSFQFEEDLNAIQSVNYESKGKVLERDESSIATSCCDSKRNYHFSLQEKSVDITAKKEGEELEEYPSPAFKIPEVVPPYVRLKED